MAVHEEALGPIMGLGFPDGCVVKEAHYEMVLDEIFAGTTEVAGVPVTVVCSEEAMNEIPLTSIETDWLKLLHNSCTYQN